MAILHPKRGERFVVADGLHISVLGMDGYGATFGVRDTNLRRTDGVLSKQIAAICRNRGCYFWFPQGGGCTLVVRCRQGKSIALAGLARLTVLNVTSQDVTIAVTGPQAAERARATIGNPAKSQQPRPSIIARFTKLLQAARVCRPNMLAKPVPSVLLRGHGAGAVGRRSNAS